jgi:hypothetical protein
MNISASVSLPPSQTQVAVRPVSAEKGDADKPSEQNSTSTDFKDAQIVSALSEQDLAQIKELKARDREVRSHEAAHLAAAGSLARGGASFSYQRGPDGVQYAVGGEVNIDTSPVAGDPAATLEKAQRIRAAALAPAQPSSQDLRVASQAAQLAVQARAEIVQEQRTEESTGNTAPATKETTEETDNESDTSVSAEQSENAITIQQAQIIADNSNAVNDTPEAILDLIA